MKVMIAGGGVAGCVSAMGMRKLGYEVVLIHRPRSFEAYEGFSQRTIEALQRARCNHALKMIGPRSPRSSVWNGISRDANSEYLTFRPDFDRALLQDTMETGVDVREGSVVGLMIDDGDEVKTMVKTDKGEERYVTDAAIDARGRFTPYSNDYYTGPQSFSLLHKLTIPLDIPARTTLHSVEDGWVWQASLGNGIGYVQMTCLYDKAQCIHNYEELVSLLKSQNSDLWVFKGAQREGAIIRRDSYGKLHKNIVKGKVFQVGDAASSVDPLSGNGVFQSLSMASILPFVIHTVLMRNESDNGVASQFYKERVNDLFYRYSNKGREFYQSEEQFRGDFWQVRSAWPELLAESSSISVYITDKAVVNTPFIESQPVVIAPNYPIGVRYFEGIDILPIVKRVLQFPQENRKNNLQDIMQGHDQKFISQFYQWAIINELI